MKVFLIAAVAVAVSGAAFAKDLKGSVMTDAEMDKVTAGDAPFTLTPKLGAFDTAVTAGHSQVGNAFAPLESASLLANRGVGEGTCTAKC